MSVRCAKRRVTAAAVLVALGVLGLGGAQSAVAAPTFVQQNSGSITAGTVGQVAFPSGNKAGDLIVVYVIRPAGVNVVLTDTRGNTYQSATGATPWKTGTRSAEVFYAYNIAAGANTVSATFSPSLTASAFLYVLEYSGIDTTAPLDAVAAAIGTASAMDSGAAPTTNANDLILGAAASSSSVTAAGTGFTSRSSASGNRVEDKVVTAAGAYNATASQNGTAWVMQMVAFKGAFTATPSVTSFSATPPLIKSGQSSTLAWVVTGTPAPTLSINNGVGAVTGSSVSVSPTKTTTYTITATNSAGTATALTTVTFITPPSVPTTLKATVISASEIDLSWKASTAGTGGAVAGYNIFRNGVQVATTTGVTYADIGLAANTKYSYTVAAFDGGGNTSAQTAAVSATTKTIPPSITSFSATPATVTTGQSATLAWVVAGTPVPTLSINNGVGTVTGASSVSVTPTKTTTYTLTATSSAGTATAQTTVTFTTAPTPPSVPTGLRATPISSSEIDLAWNASTPGSGGAVAGYKIFRGGVQVGTAAATAYPDIGLSANTTYSYTVAAFDAAGNTSAQTTAVPATTNAIPPAVNSFTATPAAINAGQSTTLAWSVSGTPTPTVSISNGVGVVNGTSVSAAPTQTTTYTLTATSSAGTATAQTTVTVTPVSPPSVPTGLGATAVSASEIDLSWTASSPGTSGTVAGYKIYRNGSQVGTSASTSYPDSGLTANTAYSYAVAAFDSAGNTSTQSSAASATTNPIPPAISSFSAAPASINLGQSSTLAWSVSGTPAPSLSINNGVGTVTGTSVSVSPTQTTTYALTATSSAGTVTSQTTVTVITPPSVPTGLGATAVSSSEIDLSWTASTPGSSGSVAGYKIFRNGSQVGTSASTSYPDSGLTANTAYSYAVAAFDSAGNTSTQSSAASATTNPIPPAISSFSAAPASINLGQSSTLAWSVSGTPAPSLSINNGVGTVTGTSVSVSPTQTTTYTLTATSSAGTVTSQTTVTVITPPSVPGGLGANVISASEIDLSWTASTPGSSGSVAGYKIYRNGAQVATSPTASYADLSLSANTGYSYTVAAFDGAGNASALSSPASATTNPAPAAPVLSSFSATPAAITAGQSTTLAWSVSGYPAPSLSINNGVGTVSGTSVSVTPSQTTTYTITATNGSGTVTAQTTVTVTQTPPSVPAGLGATAVSSSEIDLSWTASTPGSIGAVAGYKIFRNGSQVGTATSTSFPDTGLSANTGYAYTVAAYDGSGNTSAPSTPASATTAGIAPTVSSFSATPATVKAGQSSTLAWSVSGTPAPSVSIDNGVGAVTGTSVAVSPAQTTTYTLAATNSAGTVTAQASVTVNIPPSVPTGVAATAVSASEIDLSWTASTAGNGGAVTGYKICRNGTQIGTATTASYNDPGLTANTAYSYTVAAYDGAGNTSAPSAAATATTAAIAPSIGSFSAVSATIPAGQSTTLTWSVSGTPTPTLSIDNGVGAATGTSVSVSPSTTTTYTLTATNPGGSVTAQTTVTVTPPPAPPSVPVNVAATAVSASEIDISWDPSSPGDSGTVAGYKIYRNGSQIAATIVPSYIDIGLGANTDYSYSIAAFDELGNTSDSSTAVSATTFPAPVSPSVNSFAASPAAIFVGQPTTLMWSVSGYPAPDISIDNGIGTVTGTSVSVTPAQTTLYTITATNSSGTITAQTTVLVSVPVIPPSAPANVVAAAASASEIDISWDAATPGNGGAIAGYRIYRNNSQIGSTAATSYPDSGLGAYTTYSYTIVTVDASGNISSASTAVTATTNALAPSINSFSATPVSITVGQSATLAWSVSGAPIPNLSINNGVGAVTGASVSVTPSQTTTYTLTAANNAGTVTAQTTVTVTATPPSVPAGLHAAAVSASEIDLSWNASTPGSSGVVAGYKICRNGVQIGTTAGTTYPDTGLSASTAYSYTVAAFDGTGVTSAKSPAIQATTNAPLAAPTVNSFSAAPASVNAGQSSTLAWSVAGNPAPSISIDNSVGTVTGNSVSVTPAQTTTYTLTATNGSGAITAQTTVTVLPVPPSVPAGVTTDVVSATEIDLSWNASTPGSGGPVAGYKIYRNGSQVGATTATSYPDTSLNANTHYTYAVAAFDGAGVTSAQSSAVSATTNAPSQPPSVDSYTATPASITAGQSSTLAWSASGSPTPTISISGIGTVTGTSTTVSPTQTTTYNLTATSSAGSAGSQVTVTVTPTPPSVPSGLGATVASSSEIDLAWTASTPGSTGAVAGYNIFRNGSQVGTSTLASFADIGLSPGTSYSYTVAAYDGVGTTSAPSSAVSATTNPANVAPAVNSFTATPSSITTGQSSTLAWSVSGTPAPTISIDHGVGTVTGTSVSVSPTQTTTYALTATSVAGTAGSQVTVTVGPPPTPPTVPTGLSATAISAAEIDLAWNASTPGSGGAVTGYKIYRGGSQVGNATGATYADMGLTASTSYSYSVAAYDVSGNTSAQSTAIPATTKPASGTVPVDVLIAMNTNTPGTLLTPAIMNAGTIGPKQWGTGNAAVNSMTLAASMNSRVVPVAVNGVSYPTTYPSQAIAYNDTGTVQTFQEGLPSGVRRVTVAGYITLGPTPVTGNSKLFDYWLIGGAAGNYAVMQLLVGTGSSSGYGFNIETHPGSTTHSAYIPVTPGATYWCVLKADFTAAIAQLAVYSVPSFTQVGYVTGVAVNDQNISEISVGNNEAGVSPGTTSYFENMVIDYTNAAFPIGVPGGSSDTTPPTTPTGVTATPVSSSEINLSWTASTDNVGVYGYDIFRNGVKVGTSQLPSYQDSGLAPSTMYSYSVSAYDPTGNVSNPSLPINATTQPIQPVNLVQHGAIDCGTATTCALHLANNTAPGDMIVVALRVGHALGAVTITDTNGNTFLQAATKANPNDVHQLYLYYAQNIVGGADTITVKVTATNPTVRMTAMEYSGAAPSGPLDQTASAVGTGTAVSSGNVTTTAPVELIVGIATNANGVGWTAGSGFSIHDAPSNKVVDEDKIVFSAGANAATFTMASSDFWTAIVATFKPQ